MDVRDLPTAKLTFIFSDLHFFFNAEAQVTDPYIQNIWKWEVILEQVHSLICTDEKIGLRIQSMNIY